jgi:antitoxin component YwqK of YwqJK toxin-antitoxin module
MKNLILISITIVAVGCGENDQAKNETKPVEETVLEVKEEVKPKEPIAETKPTDPIAETKLEEPLAETKSGEPITETKSVSVDEMEIRGGFGYIKGSDIPYTGKVFKSYASGQRELEVDVKDGKYDGLVIWWHQNGQKKSEEKWVRGKMIYEKFWNSQGEPVVSKEAAEAK